MSANDRLTLETTGFVVIGRNEGARLAKCLDSVPKFAAHIVYVDSASTDDSVNVARSLGATVVLLPPDGKLTAARARNAGYAELMARFPMCRAVQFLDGDCILQPEWMEHALEFLRANPQVGVVCGRRFEAHPDASIYNTLCDAEWNTRVGEALQCGGDALVRREAFDQVGGFRSELLAGEEPDMSARMRLAGWKIWRVDLPMTEHDARILTLRQWWRRAQRGGFGYAQVWRATRSLPQPLYGRQLLSALLWVVVLPATIVLVTLITKQPITLVAIPVMYSIQVARIAMRSTGPAMWTRAALILLAKAPELLGATRYAISRGARRVPEYKARA